MNTAKKTGAGTYLRKKGFFALGAAGFAVLWLILWYIFPMEWYAVFFASTIGSYIQLALLSSVLIFPMCWLLALVTRRDISLMKCYPVSLALMVGTLFLFSAFRYDMPYLVALCIILHAAGMIWVTASAEPFKTEKVSRIKQEKKEKQPVLVIVSAVLYAVIINAANILLFRKIAYIYVGYGS